jgi:hypothetical protein
MTRFDRPFPLNLDWTLLILVIGICVIGQFEFLQCRSQHDLGQYLTFY